MFINLSFVTFPAFISNDIAIVNISIVCITLWFVFGYDLLTISKIFLKSFNACFNILKFLVPLFLNVDIIRFILVL